MIEIENIEILESGFPLVAVNRFSSLVGFVKMMTIFGQGISSLTFQIHRVLRFFLGQTHFSLARLGVCSTSTSYSSTSYSSTYGQPPRTRRTEFS